MNWIGITNENDSYCQHYLLAITKDMPIRDLVNKLQWIAIWTHKHGIQDSAFVAALPWQG